MWSFWCIYSCLITGDITVAGGNATTKVAFKNEKNFKAKINDIFCLWSRLHYIAMPMYTLIEYSDNYFDTCESLWQFEGDEKDNNADVTTGRSSSFKHKSDLIGNVAADGTVKNVKMTLSLKYISNFWRSLKMNWLIAKLNFA